MLTITDCANGSWKLTRNGTVDPSPLTVYEPIVIASAQTKIQQVLTGIKALVSPSARVTLVGYPHVVYNGSGGGCGFYANTVNWFASMGDLMDSSMQATASGVGGATFADLRSVYSGHEACAPSNEWINAVILFSDSGSGLKVPGSGTFHPKSVGNANASPVVRATLP